MGKPRMIILIRHAQSEGNQNREIHQIIPDHRVKLTETGWQQAEGAGRRLRELLKPDDTLQVFTSPYRRTRETTEGILRTLTARHDPDDTDSTPSPFSRNNIKVWEEPRLREQDFGNFQPCSAEMERMWRERADYGHFFYRIPNGESAADAYDRVSGFNESLWRQFTDDDFPSVTVLVTHGLMTRVFLMKWYHWSVEYFEDLRNINHCEFITMKRNDDNGKFLLQNHLRTWSELKRQKAAEEMERNPARRNTLTAFLKKEQEAPSPAIPARRWGGCVDGCEHHNDQYPRRNEQQISLPETKLPPAANTVKEQKEVEKSRADDHATPTGVSTVSEAPSKLDGTADVTQPTSTVQVISRPKTKPANLPTQQMSYLHPGRDGGGTSSGANTPHELSDAEEDSSYFPASTTKAVAAISPRTPKAMAGALRKRPQRKATPDDIERWAQESGMGRGLRADPLGDEPEEDEEGVEGERELEEAEREDKSLRGSVY
ncbi:hypothetical protein LTR91_000629 [Friedmanniomyces endolithicus]|uniref:Phosphoglycerate mutase-like protein n=1 Tax=Friedmanniomyces endolithicus TaxID=329885 RepID=A0A4U0U250_9PEZI|nr:hypothetical protein LTS09_005986 [Friedmanniomyces endolithicus]KAK0271992.1 hypothetical protein LTR35_013162 [Friedmanniomyces endolithicus]KAK0298440.1 hypothetical protein LTS00_002820 [Friedmanniomyces endolithicus]KAK0327717.1 hypothetical protein LTR82_001234 [Friedmanniomyces endolithicus]KAK0834687.1 hypothetical protein LTR73_000976 [Friedmanniomyces endolithicus]